MPRFLNNSHYRFISNAYRAAPVTFLSSYWLIIEAEKLLLEDYQLGALSSALATS
jgi:hypothetical protein